MLFGFPVQIGTSAGVFAALGYLIAGSYGLGVVAAFVGSTLVHELGHAFAFRRYGSTSAIRLHGFGGATVSYDARGLTPREHVVVSLAGPVTQMTLLGFPLGAVLLFADLSPWTTTIVGLLVFVNLGWALVNLLPIYPLDGGQVLYYFLAHRGVQRAWTITTLVSLAIAVPAAIVAVQNGYRILVLIIGYAVWQGISAREPLAANNPVHDAAARARQQHKPMKAAGRQGDRVVLEAYQQLADGNDRRVAVLLEVLDSTKKRSADAAQLRSWQAALAGEPRKPGHDQTHVLLNLMQAEPLDLRAAANELIVEIEAPQFIVAVALLSTQGRFAEVLHTVSPRETLQLMEDRLLHAGMAKAQMAVAREMRLRDAASGITPP